MSLNKIIISSLILILLIINLQAKPKTKVIPNQKIKILKPQAVSHKYDKQVVSLDLSVYCLDGENPDSVLLEILAMYPCLSPTRLHNNEAFHQHGDIYRGYLLITDDTDDNTNCLESGPIIDYEDYCIEDISYDILLDLHDTNHNCNIENTNNIYYNNNKKPIAWYLNQISASLNNEYYYPNITLSNNNMIDLWILDSGINSNHIEFNLNQIIDEDLNFNFSSSHGTGTAAVASGINYGSSKNIIIHDYPVCRSINGCAFSYIDLGLQYIIEYMKKTNKRSIINLSLGTSGANVYTSSSTYFDNLFESIINAGGIIVVSAGNNGDDACNYFFSYSANVISVGAHDSTKSKSSFSNYGDCVDIYAPGSSIPTAYSVLDNNYISYVSGTSFSSPLISGIIANYLYLNPTLTKTEIVKLLQTNVYPISNCPYGFCYGSYYSC